MTLDRIEGHTFVKSWLENGGNVVDLGMNQGRFARTIQEAIQLQRGRCGSESFPGRGVQRAWLPPMF
jgi:hypothetical protein